MFQIYLNVGIEHIIDFSAYDHMLFLLTLCGVYMLQQWKQIIVLVTAFTVGHSLSLALATLQIVSIPSTIVEIGIASSILATAIGNLLTPSGVNRSGRKIKYIIALFFGIIHGFGFSNYLVGLLGDGNIFAEDIKFFDSPSDLVGLLGDGNIFIPLLAFNLGVEIAQLIVVTVILLFAAILTTFLKISQRDWDLVVSGAGIGVSFVILSQFI